VRALTAKKAKWELLTLLPFPQLHEQKKAGEFFSMQGQRVNILDVWGQEATSGTPWATSAPT
jgi:hypothetical protein